MTETHHISPSLSGYADAYRTLFECHPQPQIVFALADGRILEANGAAELAYGFSPAELQSLRIGEIIPDAAGEASVQLTEGPAIRRNRRKNGEIFPAELHASIIVWLDEPAMHISVREAANSPYTAGRPGEDFFHTMVENLPDIVARFDRDIRHIYINPAAGRITGVEPASYIGRKPTEIFDTRLQRTAEENIALVLEKACEIKAEYEFTGPGGKRFLQTIITPELDENGNVQTALTVTHDISEHKAAEYRLLEADKRYRHVIDNAGDFIYVTDLRGFFLEANASSLGITGYTIEELRERRYLDLILPDHRSRVAKAYMRQFLDKKTALYVEFPFVDKSGRVRWFGQHSTFIYDKNEPVGFHIIAHDITGRKNEEQRLSRMNEELEQRVNERTAELEHTLVQLRTALEREKELGELKSRFVAMISHELRTPLTGILSNTEILRQYGALLESEKRDYMYRVISDSVKYMTNLLEDVLTFDREEDRGDLLLDPVCNPEFFTDLISQMEQSFPGRTVRLDADREPNLLHVDAGLLRLILSRLLTNALKFSPAGSPVSVAVRTAGKSLSISVRDEGIGIDPADMQYLFEPFFRTKEAETVQGAGMGLAIVRQSVERSGGSIRVESEKGKGSLFTVEIPLVDQASALPS